MIDTENSSEKIKMTNNIQNKLSLIFNLDKLEDINQSVGNLRKDISALKERDWSSSKYKGANCVKIIAENGTLFGQIVYRYQYGKKDNNGFTELGVESSISSEALHMEKAYVKN